MGLKDKIAAVDRAYGALKALGRDPVALYLALCARTGTRHDPCALDVLMAPVACVEHGDARPWWAFTAQRKAGWPAVEQALRAQGT